MIDTIPPNELRFDVLSPTSAATAFTPTSSVPDCLGSRTRNTVWSVQTDGSIMVDVPANAAPPPTPPGTQPR